MERQLDLGFASVTSERARDRRRGRPRHRSVTVEQLTLPLPERVEVKPTIEGTVRIEKIARELLGPKVIVKLTSNRSTMISCTRRSGVLYLRIHAIFAKAPERVLRAAVKYVSGDRTSPDENARIDEWIEANRHYVKKPDKNRVLQPHGEVHDLEAMLGRLNAAYFEGRIQARITWSRSLRKRRRHSMRLGSYDDEQKLIRIHPALDQDFVPAYFVEYVVFHEMLHEVHDAPQRGQRREVHTPAFLEDERKFANYERAVRWEQKHINRLLKY